MTEQEWLVATDPAAMRESLRGTATDRKLRMFGCACVQEFSQHVLDNRIRDASLFGELVADNGVQATDLESCLFELNAAVMEFTLARRTWTNECHIAIAVRNTLNSHPMDAFSAAGQVRSFVSDNVKTLVGQKQSSTMRDIFGNPFRPVAFDPEWRTSTVIALAQSMYDRRDFATMSILSDALQDAGCESEDILNHCRGTGPHVRGCWVVDLILGKE